jgi:hypothetical protein
LAYVSLNVLTIFSSSSEYDGKKVRRIKDAKMQYPMTGEGILAEVTELSCWTLYLQLGAVRYWKTIESDPLRTLTSTVESYLTMKRWIRGSAR